MDIRQFRYFLAIAEEGQISRAAKKLHMAQPPLSQQLQLMEQELGVTLVERKRNGKKLELTEAGKILYKKARNMLEIFEDSIQEVKETGEGLKGTLSIGVVRSCVSYLPEKMDTFNKLYPSVSFKLTGGDPYEISELLERREIELALVHPPLEMKGLVQIDLGKEPYVFVFPKDWPAAAGKHAMAFKEIEDTPLLLIRRIMGQGIYEQIIHECERLHINPRIICECPDVNILLSLVASGLGASIVPKTSILPLLSEQVKVVEITDSTLYSDTALVWSEERYLSQAARRFIEMF
ncbi:LysR family transcriptional regulator [Peribacillus sp. SCS-155]|uniref:LysR family transcriptional regulator n=1 Tax=Peribacillus sedimenti TaxID=3115297 RepID=UPI0039065AE1